MRISARRGILSLALAATLSLGVTMSLGGCTIAPSDYGAAIAEQLQAEVLEISELSAAADYPAALLAVNELEVLLKDARARGLLTEERYESILAAASMVRADLDATISADAAPDPQPAPEPEPGPDWNEENDNSDNSNNGNNGNNGNGNNGNGNGNNGKGDSDD